MKELRALISTGVLVFLLVAGGLLFTERIPEGKVGVVYSPSDGAKEVLTPGWHMVGLFEKTQEYPTRVTIIEDTISSTTNDGKKITMPVSYEMKVDASKVLNIFKELGSQDVEAIQEGYLHQKLFQASRNVVSDYSVLGIYGTKITEASNRVTEEMREGTSDLGFMVSNVVLGTPEADEETQKSIDARVQAAQTNELKKQELENEKIEAEKKRVVAEGEAQKRLIEAAAEAEANKLKSQSITPEILKQLEMEARKIHGWVTIQGATPVVGAE